MFHKSTQTLQSDLFAGSSIVDAHTRHSGTFVPWRTGFTVESRHGVDAAGPRETGVSMGTLGTKGEGRHQAFSWESEAAVCNAKGIAPGPFLQLSSPTSWCSFSPGWPSQTSLPLPPAPSLCNWLVYPISLSSFLSLLVSDLS